MARWARFEGSKDQVWGFGGASLERLGDLNVGNGPREWGIDSTKAGNCLFWDCLKGGLLMFELETSFASSNCFADGVRDKTAENGRMRFFKLCVKTC